MSFPQNYRCWQEKKKHVIVCSQVFGLLKSSGRSKRCKQQKKKHTADVKINIFFIHAVLLRKWNSEDMLGTGLRGRISEYYSCKLHLLFITCIPKWKKPCNKTKDMLPFSTPKTLTNKQTINTNKQKQNQPNSKTALAF